MPIRSRYGDTHRNGTKSRHLHVITLMITTFFAGLFDCCLKLSTKPLLMVKSLKHGVTGKEQHFSLLNKKLRSSF